MQTRKAGDLNVYDDEQMDVLEQKTAKEFDASVEAVRTYIKSRKPRGHTSQPDDVAFGIKSPVGALLVYTYWDTSDRFGLSNPLGAISSTIVRVWRKNLNPREAAKLLVEAGMQRFNGIDEIDRESDDLILANKMPDDPVVRARQLRLRQDWHQPPVSPNTTTSRTLSECSRMPWIQKRESTVVSVRRSVDIERTTSYSATSSEPASRSIPQRFILAVILVPRNGTGGKRGREMDQPHGEFAKLEQMERNYRDHISDEQALDDENGGRHDTAIAQAFIIFRLSQARDVGREKPSRGSDTLRCPGISINSFRTPRSTLL
jgi:hypothetical protein